SGTITATYEPTTGKLASLAAPSGVSLAETYDGGLVTGETITGAIAGAVSTTYDGNAQAISPSVAGTPITFQYDGDGLPIGVGSLSVQRDATTGQANGSTLGIITDTLGYDGFGQVTSYSASTTGSALYCFQINHDQLGRVSQKTETIGGVTDTYAYTYDRRG